MMPVGSVTADQDRVMGTITWAPLAGASGVGAGGTPATAGAAATTSTGSTVATTATSARRRIRRDWWTAMPVRVAGTMTTPLRSAANRCYGPEDARVHR